MDSARGSSGPGLPRHTFTDDPFFHNSFPRDSASDVFNDFGSSSGRRRFGGSNPRLFEDEFFDNFGGAGGFGNEPSFFRSSLPRRAPSTGAGFERPIHVQRQQTTPQRSPSQQRQQANHGHSNQEAPRYHSGGKEEDRRGFRKGQELSPIPAEYSPLPPTGQPHHFRQSSSPHYGGSMASGLNKSHQQQQQPQGGVHVIPVQHQQSAPSNKNIVEINNADPNSYTNGQLNPDKRRRFSNNMPQPTESENNVPMKVPIVKVEDYSTKEGEQLQPGAVSPAISEQAIPLPPPPSCEPSSTTSSSEETQGASKEVHNNNKKPMTNFVPLAGCTEQLINLLDETERRVEQLRETASQLEQEKESVLDILNNVKLSAEILKIEQSEEDELNLTAERILKRCRAVDVIVNTPRNEDQKRALDEVNVLIESVVNKMQDNLEGSKESIQRFLNACSPDEPNGHIDQRFQTKIVACTADDQKKIRRKLAQIISQIDRAERVCQTAN